AQAPPWLSALIPGLILASLVFKQKKFGAAGLVCVLLSAALLFCDLGRPDNAIKTYWSPYQRLDVTPVVFSVGQGALRKNCNVGIEILANHMIFQTAVLAPKADQPKAIYETLRQSQRAHVVPFLLKPAAPEVLIVGAGNGYDVAEALDHGAQSVD